MMLNFMNAVRGGDAPVIAKLAVVKADRKETDWYGHIVDLVLLGAVILAPLVYLPLATEALELPKLTLLSVFAAIGVITWLLGVVVRGKLVLRRTPLDIALIALLGATLIGTVFSLAPLRSLFGIAGSVSSSLVGVAVVTVLYFLIVNGTNDRGRRLRLALTLSVGVALLIGLCQMFALHFLPGAVTQSRAFTTVGSLNMLGLLAAVFLPLFVKSAHRESGVLGILIAAIGGSVAIAFLALLNWWVLWAVALVGMIAMVAFDSLNTARRDDASGLSRFIIPMAVIGIGACMLLFRFDLQSLKSQLPTEVAPSYRLSVDIIKGVFRERLLFGWGPEQFSLAFDRFGAHHLAPNGIANVRFFDANAEAFTLAAQIGSVGLLALAFLLWSFGRAIVHFGQMIIAGFSRRSDSLFAEETIGVAAAATALTAGLFFYPFSMTVLFVWYVLLALVGLATVEGRGTVVDIDSRPAYSLAASVGFVFGLVAMLAGLYFVSMHLVADIRFARGLRQAEAPAAIDDIAAAIRLDNKDDRLYRAGSQVMLTLIRTEVGATGPSSAQRTERIKSLIESAIDLAQRAVTISPHESQNWDNLGRVYASLTGIVGEVEGAAGQAFRRASEVRPGDPTFDINDGNMWIDRAQLIANSVGTTTPSKAVQEQYASALMKAEEAFRRALTQAPGFGLAVYRLGAVYERQGNLTEAIRQLESIAPYNSDQPTLLFELGLLYLRVNRINDAGAVLERAVLLAPEYSNARWYYALVLEEQGDRVGALRQLRVIRETNTDNKDLDAKIAQLEGGRAGSGDPIDTEPLE